MPKYKFTFSKPADMIIETDTIDTALKVMELRLKVMKIQIESMEEIKDD